LFDEKTEIMTLDGFKSISYLRHDDKIMTLNPESNNMEYQKHMGLVQIPYEGKMVQFHGISYDYLVMPEHLMYVRRHSGKFTFASAISVYEHLNEHPHAHVELKKDGIWKGNEIESYSVPIVESRQFRHPKSGMLVTHHGVRNPQKISPETWLKFIGWYLTEGSCNVHGKRKAARVSIAQTMVHPENRAEIKQVLEDIGFGPYMGKSSIDIGSRSLYEYLKPLGNSYTHYIPSELKNLPPAQLRILIETMMKGDGSPDGRLFTVSKKMADDFQEIVTKAGYSASVSFRGDGYRISIIKKECTPLITKAPSLVDYSGFVYNLTVPKYHVIMIRRSGRTGWSSSSISGMNVFGK
jgi:ribonucleoside-triphosphate reductase (formate)